jgi:hypothetical protein
MHHLLMESSNKYIVLSNSVKYDTKLILYVNTTKTLAAYLTTILFGLMLAPIPVDDQGGASHYIQLRRFP